MANKTVTVHSASAWQSSHSYALGDVCSNDGDKRYICITAGTSASSGGPTGTGTDITDGSAHWRWQVTSPTYSSLNAALAGESANLVTNTCILTIECYAMEDTTNADTGTGYTTSSSYYINIVVPAAERHTGKWSASKYRLVTAGPAGTASLGVQKAYTRVVGVQVHNTAAVHFTIGFRSSNCTSVVYEKCIAWMDGGNYVKTGFKWSINYVGYLINCLSIVDSSYNHDDNGGFLAAESSTLANTTYLYNCTAIGGNTGFKDRSDVDQTVVLKNCLAYGFALDGFNISYPGTSDYNASTDDTAPGANSRQNQTFTFVDAANDDFHLASTDAGARDGGVSDPGSGLFSDDIDGQTRSGSWDIGADEYVAAGISIPVAMHHYMHN